MNTETKGTVLIKTADELKSFSKGEEDLIESVSQYIYNIYAKDNSLCLLPLSLSHTHTHTQQVKAIADAGCNVVVTGGKFGEIALHFLNKYKIMAIR